MKNKLQDFFSSSDLALVGTISLWYPIEMIDKHDGIKVIFYFKRDENLDKLLESYWRRELKVEPQTYFAQLKIVKTRLYEQL